MPCRLKPGSLAADGTVVGLYPVRDPWTDPVVVPADYGVSLRRTVARCQTLERAGWRMCPPALQPRILERGQTCLIHVESPAYQLWLQTPPDRRRAGAARP